jgi:hypothetical protein
MAGRARDRHAGQRPRRRRRRAARIEAGARVASRPFTAAVALVAGHTDVECVAVMLVAGVARIACDAFVAGVAGRRGDAAMRAMAGWRAMRA